MLMKLACFIVLILTTQGVYADDIGDSINANDEMQRARTLIEDSDFTHAVSILHTVVDQEHRNADAWNLLGFAYRNLGKYLKAADAYEKALAVNADHKGALEYQGELFVLQGKLYDAKANRAKLEKLCPAGCEQLTDLDNAIVEAGG